MYIFMFKIQDQRNLGEGYHPRLKDATVRHRKPLNPRAGSFSNDIKSALPFLSAIYIHTYIYIYIFGMYQKASAIITV